MEKYLSYDGLKLLIEKIKTALNGKSDTGHTHSAVTTSVNGFMSTSDKAKLDGLNTYYVSSVTTAMFEQSEMQSRLVNLRFLAYWNGAHSGTASNLAYCKQGAFGTIITKSSNDYIPKITTGTHELASYLKYSYSNVGSGTTQLSTSFSLSVYSGSTQQGHLFLSKTSASLGTSTSKINFGVNKIQFTVGNTTYTLNAAKAKELGVLS